MKPPPFRKVLIPMLAIPLACCDSQTKSKPVANESASLETGHNAESLYALGVSYREGIRVKQSDAEAFNYFKKAAEMGHSGAQYNLGRCFADGKGTPKNLTGAALWYQKAAEQGDATSQFVVGNAFINGEGVSQHDEEAAKWFRKASEQRCPGA